METTLAGTIPTSAPGLLLRPVRWPEQARLIADVNNASRRAGGSLFVRNVEMVRTDYAHLVNSDLAADPRLAEADGGPVGYERPRAAGLSTWRRPLLPDGTSATTPGRGA